MGCGSISEIDASKNEKNNNKEKEKEENTKKEENVKKEENEGKEENEEKKGKEEPFQNKGKKKGEIINLQCAKKDPGFVPDELIDTLRESVVRIEIKNPHIISTGFFIKINLKKKEYKFLFTCEHSIPKEIIDSKTKISIYYGRKNEEIKKKIILDNDQRYIKQIKDLDVTIIEIKEEDNIYENRFLHPDLNYKMGLEHYLNSQVYTAGYPIVDIHKGDKHYSAGIIKQVYNNGYIFTHNCDTKEGSSGGPIINYDKLVIGMHFGNLEEQNINVGTFIGVIINELFLEEKKINPLMEEDDKEDEKENPGLGGIELGFLMMDQMLKNEEFVNMTQKMAKSINFQQFCSNLMEQPIFKEFNVTPEEMEKLKDKDKKVDQGALYKYSLGKLGYNKNEQEVFYNNMQKFINNPNLNKIQNDIQNQINQDNK